MKLFISLLSLVLFLGINNCVAYPMDSMHWNHRSILYFAPEKDQHVQEFMKQVLMNECVLQERDIKTVIITNDGFNQPYDLFSPEEINHLQQKYNIPKEHHTGILVGKDGLEKHRWNEKTNWLQLTEIVDRMPLRKEEMRHQASRCQI